MMKNLLLPFCSFMLAAGLQAQVSVQLQQVATGLPEVVGLANAGDERLFCVLSPGTIRIIDDGALLPTPFLNITSQVTSGGERGLLGLAFHPNYAQNGFFYVHYTTSNPGLTSRISRFSVSPTDPDSALVDSQLIIYETSQPAGNHNGGDLQFGPDGFLYISLGDGGGAGDGQNNAQNLGTPLGALLRIDIDVEEGTYGIPPTNPFIGDTTATPEIWAYGLRNPWRIGFDALNGDLWIGDVGQNAWEEIDHWPNDENWNSGPNFGWRCYEGLVPYNTAGCGASEEYVFPLAVHPNGPWASIIGGRVYRGAEFPSLYGRYIYTDYSVGQIWSLLPDGAGGWENEMIAPTQGSGMVTIAENNELELFFGNRNTGIVYKMVDPNVSVDDRSEVLLSMYPVPARDIMVIEGELSGARELLLFDLAGRKVAGHSIGNDVTRTTLDVSVLNSGAYVLVLNDASGREFARRLVSVSH